MSDGFTPLAEAYETAVQTLEPDARPGDEYLSSLDDEQARTAYDKIDQLERTVEAAFRTALATKRLAAYNKTDSGMKKVRGTKRWSGLASGLPSLGDGNDFLSPAPNDAGDVHVSDSEFAEWLSKTKAAWPTS